jgi:hypothetical protein
MRKSPGSPLGFWTTIVGRALAVCACGWLLHAQSEVLPAAISSITKFSIFYLANRKARRLRGT